QGALFFSRYTRSVTMLVRASDLAGSMSQYLVDRINLTSNITVKTGVELRSVSGDGHLNRISVRHAATGAEESIETAALFIFIGVAPRTDAVVGCLCMDEKGFIMTGPELRHI